MILAAVAAALAVIGAAQAIAGYVLVLRFIGAVRPDEPDELPPVTLLKPLHGDEPLLEQALASVCQQDYPRWQVVFGVSSTTDPALFVVRRLQARFPGCDIAVVADATLHGANRKVGNLINMLPAARHDLLVIADSDLHVEPDYLRRLVAGFRSSNVGLVTTLYTGLPAHGGLAASLGALQINQGFLPGALLARRLGREDCLGATMALRRETLERIGGLHALVHHLADDNLLGRLVQRLGLRVALADTVPATTVPEPNLSALWRHELRWARTIRALAPGPFAASVLQYALAWALLAMVASHAAPWSFTLFAAIWLARAIVTQGIHRAFGLAFTPPVWLLPLRDLMSVAVMMASYAGRTVDWRGHTLQAEGLNPR